MNLHIDKPVRHVIQTLLNQIVDVNNHVRSIQDNPELEQEYKVATTSTAHYHLMVLAVLLHELKDIVLEKFPDAQPILEWSENHYNLNLEKGAIKPCKCDECKEPIAVG